MKILPQNILIRDYTYELPHDRIAEFPLNLRDQSRLLVYQKGNIIDERFYHLANYLDPDTNLILNNTRVIEARLLFQKETGGVIAKH
jgi:S-adenosylmethionine:tRNA ribosyltransferase-isomerase